MRDQMLTQLIPEYEIAMWYKISAGYMIKSWLKTWKKDKTIKMQDNIYLNFKPKDVLEMEFTAYKGEMIKWALTSFTLDDAYRSCLSYT